MADTKISALADASTLAGTEVFPLVQSATTVKVTFTVAHAFFANPITSDSDSLGTSTLMWSDLFLASGGVVNWSNGDVTITHSANTLAFAGASSGYTFDARVSTSSDQIGIATSKTPSSASDTGVAGTVCWDSGYLYVCTATDTWKRVAIATW